MNSPHPLLVAIGAKAVAVLWWAITLTFGRAYDSSQSLVTPPAAPGCAAAEGVVQSLVRPLANWDGMYFTHLAQHGYTVEQFHAFFPLLPYLATLAR